MPGCPYYTDNEGAHANGRTPETSLQKDKRGQSYGLALLMHKRGTYNGKSQPIR